MDGNSNQRRRWFCIAPRIITEHNAYDAAHICDCMWTWTNTWGTRTVSPRVWYASIAGKFSPWIEHYRSILTASTKYTSQYSATFAKNGSKVEKRFDLTWTTFIYKVRIIFIQMKGQTMLWYLVNKQDSSDFFSVFQNRSPVESVVKCQPIKKPYEVI